MTPVALALVLGCGPGGEVAGPPEIHYGLEECSYCRMIISEERFAAATIESSGTVEKYDDLGCLVAARRDRPPNGSAAAVWVHDAASGRWIRAETSWFVRSEPSTTPMGSGILAYETREAAAGATQADRVVTWDQLFQTAGIPATR